MRVTAFALLTLVLLYVVGARISLSLLPKYEQDIELFLADTIGTPIYFDGIEADWIGFDPVITAKNISLTPDSKPIVGSIAVRLAVLDSLLEWQPKFKSVLIDKSHLDVRQVNKKHLIVAGIDIDFTEQQTSGSFDLSLVSNTLDGAFITVSDSQVNFTSIRQETRLWMLPLINVSYEDNAIYASGQLVPSGSIQPLVNFSLQGHKANRSAAFDGVLYLEARSNKFFSEVLSVYDFEGLAIQDLDLSSRLWVDFAAGSVSHVNGDIQIKQLDWSGPSGNLTPIKNIAASFNVKLLDNSRQVDLSGFRFDYAERHCGSLDASLTMSDMVGSLYVETVDLECLTEIATATKILPKDLQQRLLKSQPTGSLKHINLSWDDKALSAFNLEAELSNVSLEDYLSTPMAYGIDGYLRVDQFGGGVYFQSDRFHLGFPTLFLEPWNVAFAEGAVFWETTEEDIDVFSDGLRLWMPDGSLVYGDFILRLNPDNQEDYLSLALGMQSIPFTKVTRFVPYHSVDNGLYDWLDGALVEGTVTDGIYLGYGSVEGDDSDAPFTSSLLVNTESGQLNFSQEWPQLEELNVEVSLQDTDLSINANKAKINGADLEALSVTLDDSSDLLQASMNVSLPPQQLDYWLKESPIAANTKNIAEQLSISGNTNANIQLGIPLEDNDEVAYEILGRLSNQNIAHIDSGLLFETAKGDLRVSSETGISAKGIETLVFGEPAMLTIDTRFVADESANIPVQADKALSGDAAINDDSFDVGKFIEHAQLSNGENPSSENERASNGMGNAASNEPEIVLNLVGRTEVNKLLSNYDLEPVPELGGAFDFNASLSLPGDKTEHEHPLLTITSDLRGLEFNWPKPLSKGATDLANLKYEMLIAPDQMDATVILQGKELPAVEGQLLFGEKSLKYGMIKIGETESPKQRDGTAQTDTTGSATKAMESIDAQAGVHIVASLEALELESWIDFVSNHLTSESASSERPWLRTLDLSVATLDTYGYLVEDVKAEFNHDIEGLAQTNNPSTQKAGETRSNSVVQNGGVSSSGLNKQAASDQDSFLGWSVSLSGDGVMGKVYLPAAEGDIEISLDRLAIKSKQDASSKSEAEESQTEASDVSHAAADKETIGNDDAAEETLRANRKEINPGDIPAMDITASAIKFENKNIAFFRTLIEPKQNGVYFGDLSIHLNDLRLKGYLDWVKEENKNNSRLALDISGGDIERLMELLDWPPTINSEEIEGRAELRWPDDPLNFELANLEGEFKLKMQDGFLKTSDEKTGALRFLGILNAEALVRRLKLDFSDLYKSGVGYDSFSVKGTMSDGQLKLVEPLLIDGPSSAYEIKGSTNLRSKELNMKMKVKLPIAQNAPLAALLLGAPQIGGAVWLVDKLLGEPLADATSANYTITGRWDDPKLDYGK